MYLRMKIRQKPYIKKPLHMYILPFILGLIDSAPALLKGKTADQGHLNKISFQIPSRGPRTQLGKDPDRTKNVTRETLSKVLWRGRQGVKKLFRSAWLWIGTGLQLFPEHLLMTAGLRAIPLCLLEYYWSVYFFSWSFVWFNDWQPDTRRPLYVPANPVIIRLAVAPAFR